MNSLKALLLGSALSVAALGAAQAGTITIDEFSGPATSLTVNSSTTTASVVDQTSAPGSIMGDYRDIYLNYISGGTFANAIIEVGGGVGSFIHQQGGAANTASTTLKYDGQAGGGLNKNFTGLSGIVAGVQESDAGMAWEFTLIDGAGKKAVAVKLTPDVDFDGNTHDFYTAFSEFTVDAGFDWTDVDVFQLIANFDADGAGTTYPKPTLDVTLDYIRVVPEPATLALFGAGLLGLGFARRRKA